jgi:hypothetical protein
MRGGIKKKKKADANGNSHNTLWRNCKGTEHHPSFFFFRVNPCGDGRTNQK